MDRSKKIYFSRRMLSNEHIGKKYLDRLKESNAINLENNYKILIVKNKGPTYLTNHPTDHLQYSNNIVAKTDPTAPRTIVIIVDKIRVKTGLLFTKSKI